MTNKKFVDTFLMKVIPEVDKKDTRKLENDVEKATEDGTSAGLKKGSKSIFNKASFLKVGLGAASVIAGVVAGVVTSAVAIGVKTTNETVDNIRQQLDVADNLATKAAQAGIKLEDFLKIQKTLEFGDVAPDIASQAIIEFEKRLGDFKTKGLQSEFFGRLGITKDTSDTEALLKAISAVQNLQGAEKNVTASRFFGGFGIQGLSEFLSGNLKDQLKEIQNIDFEKLATQVTKGSDEQTRITRAETQARTDKLLQTDLDASLSILRIQNEAQRTITKSNTENVAELAESIETSKNIWNGLTVAVTKLTNTIATEGNDVVDIAKFITGNSNIVSD
jgi:hypothetical protein